MDIVGPHACSSVSEWSWIVLHGSLAINIHELVCLHRSLILMKMGQWILSTVVVGIIVCIDGLRFKACNGIELLDRRSTETCKSPEHSTFDLRHLSVLHCINKSVLGLSCMVLQPLAVSSLPKGAILLKFISRS